MEKFHCYYCHEEYEAVKDLRQHLNFHKLERSAKPDFLKDRFSLPLVNR